MYRVKFWRGSAVEGGKTWRGSNRGGVGGVACIIGGETVAALLEGISMLFFQPFPCPSPFSLPLPFDLRRSLHIHVDVFLLILLLFLLLLVAVASATSAAR